MESLLSATVEAAIESKAVKARDRKRERRVRLAKAHGVPLRQSYVRVGPRLLFKNNRYGYARHTAKRLMDDIKSGLIDTVVVYKVDRLSRSLADFAKLIELFDEHKVSFVSVTQQFNTTTSMG